MPSRMQPTISHLCRSRAWAVSRQTTVPGSIRSPTFVARGAQDTGSSPSHGPDALLSSSGVWGPVVHTAPSSYGVHVRGGTRTMKKRWLFARLGVVGALVAGVLAPTPAQSISASLSAEHSPVWQTNASVQGLVV